MAKNEKYIDPNYAKYFEKEELNFAEPNLEIDSSDSDSEEQELGFMSAIVGKGDSAKTILENQEKVNLDSFKLIKRLGEGAHAKVYLVQKINDG